MSLEDGIERSDEHSPAAVFVKVIRNDDEELDDELLVSGIRGSERLRHSLHQLPAPIGRKVEVVLVCEQSGLIGHRHERISTFGDSNAGKAPRNSSARSDSGGKTRDFPYSVQTARDVLWSPWMDGDAGGCA